jgi:glycosyltransferase involved in cell wall biosynthesis
MFDVELALWREVEANIYPSQDEAEHVAGYVGWERVHAVPLYFFRDEELVPSSTPREPDRLLFVACFGHPPNEDAAAWLVEEILPLIRERRPDIRLDLVGSLPTERVLALAGPHVRVTGAVSREVLEEHYRTATLAITPMRFGAGVKLKVLEAMARGIPLVTTPVGAQGLPGLEECVDVQDTAEGLARAVLARLSDPAEASRRADQARDYVRANYSPANMRAALWRALTSSPPHGVSA